LNHYYKRVIRQNWGNWRGKPNFVWQLVPDIFDLDADKNKSELDDMMQMPENLRKVIFPPTQEESLPTTHVDWRQMGYWHIGRSQVMSSAYGMNDFYNNDMANILKTNHLDITLQPIYMSMPCKTGRERIPHINWVGTRLDKESKQEKKRPVVLLMDSIAPDHPFETNKKQKQVLIKTKFTPPIKSKPYAKEAPVKVDAPLSQDLFKHAESPKVADEDRLPDLSSVTEPINTEEIEIPMPGLSVKTTTATATKTGHQPKQKKKGSATIDGSLLKDDGKTEPCAIHVLS
jgi:hypothetical protein